SNGWLVVAGLFRKRIGIESFHHHFRSEAVHFVTLGGGVMFVIHTFCSFCFLLVQFSSVYTAVTTTSFMARLTFDEMPDTVRLTDRPRLPEQPPVHAREKAFALSEFSGKQRHAFDEPRVDQLAGVYITEGRTAYEFKEFLLRC